MESLDSRMHQDMAHLQAVPAEIFDRIVDDLDLGSIKSLRLTCKAVASRCIGPRFKSFVASQETDLTPGSLDSLLDLASHSVLGQAVKSVAVVAVAFDTSELESMLRSRSKRVVERTAAIISTTTVKCTEEELAQAQKDLDWLRAQIERRKNEDPTSVTGSFAKVLRQFGRIQTLQVDACVLKGEKKRVSAAGATEWSPMFIRASEVYRIATSAVAQSKVSLEFLTLYRFVPRCGIPSFDITAHMETLESEGFAEAGASIKNFAIQLSTRTETDVSKIYAARARLQGAERAFHQAMGSSTGQYSEEDAEATAEDNFPGVARLLKQMPNLEALDLHLRNTLRGSAKNYVRIFTAIAEEVCLPSLEQCFIRGLCATEESLLKFIGSHPKLNHLELRDINLLEGSWEPILTQLSRMPSLSRLCLSNLFGGGHDVMDLSPRERNKDTIDKWHWRGWTYPCDEDLKVHTREFARDEIQQGLVFPHQNLGCHLGSPQFVRWLNKRTADYRL